MYHCNETIKSDKDQNDIALKAQLICYFSSFEDRTTTKMILFFFSSHSSFNRSQFDSDCEVAGRY